MWMALGAAASSAIGLLSSLKQSGSGQAKAPGLFDLASNAPAANNSASSPKPLSIGKDPVGATLSPDTYAALLAAQSQETGRPQTPQNPSDALKDLFSLLDNDGDGQISKTEFETDLGAGGTNLKAADRVFAMLDKDSSGSVGEDELSSALKALRRPGHDLHRAQNTSNGSDAANAANSLLSSNAASSYNFIEQMVQRQGNALSASVGQSISVSA